MTTGEVGVKPEVTSGMTVVMVTRGMDSTDDLALAAPRLPTGLDSSNEGEILAPFSTWNRTLLDRNPSVLPSAWCRLWDEWACLTSLMERGGGLLRERTMTASNMSERWRDRPGEEYT